METYELNIAGVTRHLPLRRVNEHLQIAAFIMLGDTELVEAVAAEMVKLMPEGIEYLVTPETKSIPLCHAMARLMGIDYVVLRKRKKVYMRDALTVVVKSITDAKDQELILDGTDAKKINGRRVAVIDDVISTGGSLKAVEELLSQTTCVVAAKAAALLEEGGYKGDDVITLGTLPVFVD